jgi:Zn-dependent metalloprotease
VRLTIVFFALLFACHFAFAEEGRGSSSHSRTDVRFDENAPELSSQEEVEDWVKSDLKKELGLGEDHDLEVGKKSTGLGSGSTYEVKQTLNGIPVVSLETRVILGPDKKPLYVLGKSNGEIKSEVTEPTITIEQALEVASHIPDTDFEYRLVYWLDAEPKPYLAFEIQGSFAVENMPSEQRVYVDATNAKILERLSLQHSALQRGVAHFA